MIKVLSATFARHDYSCLTPSHTHITRVPHTEGPPDELVIHDFEVHYFCYAKGTVMNVDPS